LIILAVAYVPMVIGAWKVFAKAGEPGWASIVPVYNAMVAARIGGRPETDGLFTLIPIVGIYFGIVILIDMVKAFGKDAGFAIGMLLLPIVFWPILGFGSAQFIGAGKARRRDVDDDYDRPAPRGARPRDEDDEGIRRPRRRDDDDDEGGRRPRRRDDDDDDEGVRRPRR
jgi:hypothetical protein